MDNKRYPVGKFEKPDIITRDLISEWITIIAAFPENLTKVTENLSDKQLDTPYREGGWTLRQVIHHCADSHINALCRIKLAITEDSPMIKPYLEDKWAELTDSKTMPVDASLLILCGLHQRWTILLNNLDQSQLNRNFIHPEHGKKMEIGEVIGMYAWHCRHHLAHITTLKKAKGWS